MSAQSMRDLTRDVPFQKVEVPIPPSDLTLEGIENHMVLGQHVKNWIGDEVQGPCRRANAYDLRAEVLTGLPERFANIQNYISRVVAIGNQMFKATLTEAENQTFLANRKITKLPSTIVTLTGYIPLVTKLNALEKEDAEAKSQLEACRKTIATAVSALAKKAKKMDDLNTLFMQTDGNTAVLISQWNAILSTTHNLTTALQACVKGIEERLVIKP